ncbi:MAG: hypothetical protein KY469_22270, partial [Actinobacteria bacterium]|nr:hypothetical protein [Actinomycetota bacterium]
MESKELLGSRELWGYENFELTDRRTARVNVASGNLHLSERDLAIGGTAGHDAAVTRGYNSQFGSRTEAGRSWMLLPGNFTGLWILTESVVLRADGHVVFTREQGASTFRSPTGFDADLVKNTGGSYTLTFRRSDETWQYNSAGLLTSRQDRFGNTITYTYDLLSGELASMTDTQSRVTNFTWSTVNGARMITRVTGPGGRTYDYGYTTDYLLEIYTDPAANVTDYDYDASKRVIRVTDPEGNKTKFAYDSNDRVTSLTRVDDAVNDTGPTWTFDYTVAWKTVVTDPRSNTTTYHFDRHGRVTKVVDALGNERSSEYHSSSQVESYTDRTSGTPVTNSYTTDGLDNLASTELPTGATTEFAYTDTNNPYGPSEISSTGGATRQISYDTDGALATITDAQTACSGGCKVSLTRNGDGTIATVTDPRGHVTSYGYTSGNRTSIDPPAPQGDTTITYDALSRVDTVTYPNATTVDFGYDAFDRVTSATYGDATSVTYLYDDAGNRTSRVDPTGTTTTLYDELNRITGETFPGSRTTSYVYDDAGNLTSMTDPAGTVSYSYDAVNQVNLMTEPGSAVTDFDFDVAGNLDDITYPNSVVVDYQHDDSNRIKKIAATNGLSTVLAERVYTYNVGIDDTLLRRTVTDENGEVTTYGYDSTDRLTSAVTRGASSNLLDDVGFDYDPSGNLLERDDDGTREWFGYDAANQLTDTMAELGDVLLVVGDPAALTSGDTAVKNRLTGLGATVTTRDDHSSEATSGYDLVVIAESIVSNAVASKYDEDATMAVVNMEDSAWDDHGLATASGTPYTPTQLDIADTVHVGAAGPAGDLAGTTITHTSAGTTEVATAAQIGGDAHVIAERPSSTDAAAFTYQAGATLANAATAGARRVALGYEDDAYTSLSSDGWIVFDNLVRWASGVGYHHDTAGNLTGSDGGLDLGYDAGNDTDSLTAL